MPFTAKVLLPGRTIGIFKEKQPFAAFAYIGSNLVDVVPGYILSAGRSEEM
jgi:hypothetical protein